MQMIEKRLQELYLKKEAIQNEITSLESQLKLSLTKPYKPSKTFSKQEKIDLFRQLFIANQDYYGKKWVSSDKNKQNFFPVSKTFKGEDYIPLGSDEIEAHLRGTIHLATYPILYKNYSKYTVLQIEEKDVYKIALVIQKFKLKAYYERNSEADVHVWIFFGDLIFAKMAKTLGEKILREVNCKGKIFPNQDFSNKSSLGNPLELPLHLQYRNENKTVFIDITTKKVIEDQWAYLWEVEKNQKSKIELLVSVEVKNDPWVKNEDQKLELPTVKIELILYDMVYIKNESLSKSFLNKLKDLACFDNPQVKILLGLRKPLYNIPRVIKNYEEDEEYLKLPRGLLSKIIAMFKEYKVKFSLNDKRYFYKEDFPAVTYTLREEQNTAIKKILKNDFSICVAPPGFGKTLIGAKMIEQRSCSTLIVVNKNMLLDQWIQRFVDYFKMDKKEIGFLVEAKKPSLKDVWKIKNVAYIALIFFFLVLLLM